MKWTIYCTYNNCLKFELLKSISKVCTELILTRKSCSLHSCKPKTGVSSLIKALFSHPLTRRISVNTWSLVTRTSSSWAKPPLDRRGCWGADEGRIVVRKKSLFEDKRGRACLHTIGGNCLRADMAQSLFPGTEHTTETTSVTDNGDTTNTVRTV